MMCPVCKRDLAPTLSICLTCGAMIHDTVREELETKISKAPARPTMTVRPYEQARPAIADAPFEPEQLEKPEMFVAPTLKPDPAPARIATPNPVPVKPAPVVAQPPVIARPTLPATMPTSASIAPPPKPIAARFDTANLGVKKTSPTLVEFQPKKATVPEWRLQLQNTVRQKVSGNRRIESSQNESTQSQPRSTNGANALKVEFIEEDQPSKHENPRLANALKRIEQSRRTFTNQPIAEQSVNVGKPAATRNYPFNVVTRSNEPPKRPGGQRATVNASPKPMLVSPLKIEKKGYDTNKLPPLTNPSAPVENAPVGNAAPKIEVDAARERWEQLDVDEISVVETEPETDEIEDLAPFSMRVAAGLFDLIIGVFTTFILLSPFIVSGGTWMTVSGGLAIAAAVAIVMFLYLTASIAFVGRTVGMRLFSLELVDIEANAYPTLHQAAVNSAVYLLSIAVGGLGFLTVFFNEERRAAHDILSGTILVREY
jgi:uncharacterized RDD family membrane protein YckC